MSFIQFSKTKNPYCHSLWFRLCYLNSCVRWILIFAVSCPGLFSLWPCESRATMTIIPQLTQDSHGGIIPRIGKKEVQHAGHIKKPCYFDVFLQKNTGDMPGLRFTFIKLSSMFASAVASSDKVHWQMCCPRAELLVAPGRSSRGWINDTASSAVKTW